MQTPSDGPSTTPRASHRDLLDLLLAEGGEESIAFAREVFRHLDRALALDDAGRTALVAEIAFQVADPDASDEALAARLAANPHLLASFFQNADLLPPGTPVAYRIGRSVMASLQRLDGGDLER
jgi:hypothetical protein